MTEIACTCRRHAIAPDCPKHGWNRQARLGLFLVACFYVVVAIAVVVTAQGGV